MSAKISQLTTDADPADDDILEWVDISDGASDAANSKSTRLEFFGRIQYKLPVRVATTTNGTLASAFANGQTVDGITLATGDRILLKDQSTATENGIYTVNVSGAPTRAVDYDSSLKVIGGNVVTVQEGTQNADSQWILTNNGTITIGSTNLAYSRYGDAEMVDMLESAPGIPLAGRRRLFNYNVNDGKIVNYDENGLIEFMGTRDIHRWRRSYYFGVGSDTTLGTDNTHWGLGSMTTEGTLSEVVRDVNGPMKKNFATAAATDSDGGFFTGTLIRINDNPDFTIKFRLPATTSQRTWIGFTEADHMASDSTAATHKFMLRCSSTAAVTGFTIVHSNGTTETIESQISAANTNVHTIRIIADNGNTRWGYSFDGASIVWITSNIPTSGQDMFLQVETRCTTATARNLELSWVDGTADI